MGTSGECYVFHCSTLLSKQPASDKAATMPTDSVRAKVERETKGYELIISHLPA